MHLVIAMDDWGQLSMAMPETVQSVVRCQENGPLIAAAAQLWIEDDDLVVDMTYGRGLFWTKCHPARLVGHDLITDGVDFRQLPEADGTVDVAVFDPPYISPGGRGTSTLDGRNGSGGDFNGRYGLTDTPTSPAKLAELIAHGIREANRVLAPQGRLMVKCMDYVSSGGLFLGRHHVVTTALGLGMRQVDEFVHHSGTGPQPTENPDGSPRRQVHSRRAHSFLCVFQKPRRTAPIDGSDD
jgi:hypothetical protein